MVWYWKVLMAWVVFNLLFVLGAWMRSVIVERTARSTSGDWRVRHLPERLVRRFFECPWPTFGARSHPEVSSYRSQEDVHAIAR
jgi:hypothetical protein